MKTKIKSKKAEAPLTRNEFKAAISKMTRNELIGVLCDIYYTSSQDGKGAKDSKGSCECDCGCGCDGDSKKTMTPKRPKSKASKKK